MKRALVVEELKTIKDKAKLLCYDQNILAHDAFMRYMKAAIEEDDLRRKEYKMHEEHQNEMDKLYKMISRLLFQLETSNQKASIDSELAA